MEIIEPFARNAPTLDETNATDAFRLSPTPRAPRGPVGIVAGQAASSFKSGRLTDPAAAWVAKSRKISRGTLDRLGVESDTVFFPDIDDKCEAIVFRYPNGWKARSFPPKHFVAGKGFKLAFWNIDRVLAAKPSRVFITEGEFDACALVEAGVDPREVLSVPNGAKEKPAEDVAETRGYDFVREALQAGLNNVKQIIWCGDADGPGLTLRSDMARMFGAARFWFVNWPEGCKDANDMLAKDGPQLLFDLVNEGALPWPVAGLYRMSELPEPAPMTLWEPGFDAWHGKVRLAARTMSVVTGHPGHGKTALWAQIWFNVVREYGVPMCVASFETRPKPHYRRALRTLLMNRLERDLTDHEIATADKWIDQRYIFLVHPDQRPTIPWFLEMAEVAVIRHGVRIIQVDPWNRMESARAPGETETDFIGKCLREIHSFAHDMNCHVQVLAHPAKMDSQRRGSPPSLEDISGSKHWDNMVDQGFVVHRPEVFDGNNRKTEAVLYHRKARFEELGYPCKLQMNYEINRGRYVSMDLPDYP